MNEQFQTIDQIKATAIDMVLKFGPKVLVATAIMVAGHFVGRDACARGNNNPVVGVRAVFAHNLALHRINCGNRIKHKVDTTADKILFGANAALRGIHAERNQKPTGLIMMYRVTINDRYFPFSFTQELSHLRGYHGSASASTKNKQFFHLINPNSSL